MDLIADSDLSELGRDEAAIRAAIESPTARPAWTERHQPHRAKNSAALDVSRFNASDHWLARAIARNDHARRGSGGRGCRGERLG